MALFNNFPTEATPYNGDSGDIAREQRLNNWINSYKLNNAQREAVQTTMLKDPYTNRNATQDMNLLNENAKGFLGDTRRAQDAALSAYIAKQEQQGQAQAPRRAAAPAASFSPSAAGNINGVDVRVPTAGNYMNGAYQHEMGQLGLGETPTADAYQQAVYSHSPQVLAQRQAAQQHQYAMELQDEKNKGIVASHPPKIGGGSNALGGYQKLVGQDAKFDAKNQGALDTAYNRYTAAQVKQAQTLGQPLLSEQAWRSLTPAQQQNAVYLQPQEAWAKSDPVAMALLTEHTNAAQANGSAQRKGIASYEDHVRGNESADVKKANDLNDRMLGKPGAYSGGNAGVAPNAPATLQPIAVNPAVAHDKVATAIKAGYKPAQILQVIAAKNPELLPATVAALTEQGHGAEVSAAGYGSDKDTRLQNAAHGKPVRAGVKAPVAAPKATPAAPQAQPRQNPGRASWDASHGNAAAEMPLQERQQRGYAGAQGRYARSVGADNSQQHGWSDAENAVIDKYRQLAELASQGQYTPLDGPYAAGAAGNANDANFNTNFNSYQGEREPRYYQGDSGRMYQEARADSERQAAILYQQFLASQTH